MSAFWKVNPYSTGTPSEKGYMGYYSLLDWWENDFTQTEREYVLEKYNPMGGVSGLDSGTMIGSTASALNFLTGLQSWFTTLKDEVISEKILKKAESLLLEKTPILDYHFLYQSLIKHYYKKRNIDSSYYELAKKYCRKQIELNPEAKEAFQSEYPWHELPSHVGYNQLAIILEKEKKYKDAIELCKKAREEGWGSDFSKRILRLNKKLQKTMLL